MTKTELSFPELGLLVGTRGMLGAGLGLLLGDKLDPGKRKAVGWTLVAVGVLSTIPLAWIVFGHRKKTQQLPSNRGEPYAKRTEADAYAAAR
jgi:hypothetical protein